MDSYLWIKALHIIAVISWMAGLLYLPRLFVYHHQTEPNTQQSKTFLTMERKLLKIIMLPAVVLSCFFGGWLLSIPGLIDWHDGWLHLKLFLIFLMLAFHGMCYKWYSEFEKDQRKHTQTYFRLANEIPTLLMIVIVILVVVRPF